MYTCMAILFVLWNKSRDGHRWGSYGSLKIAVGRALPLRKVND